MATFEVIVLGVQGINNKVFGPGAKVTEAHFPEGNALKLEKEGKLKRISGNDAKSEEELAKEQKLKELKKTMGEAKKTLDIATKAFNKAPKGSTEEQLAALKKAVDDAQLAFEIAEENFENA